MTTLVGMISKNSATDGEEQKRINICCATPGKIVTQNLDPGLEGVSLAISSFYIVNWTDCHGVH
jgi:hypothetical protein